MPDLVEPNPCSTAAKTFFHAAVDSGVISSKQWSDLFFFEENYIMPGALARHVRLEMSTHADRTLERR